MSAAGYLAVPKSPDFANAFSVSGLFFVFNKNTIEYLVIRHNVDQTFGIFALFSFLKQDKEILFYVKASSAVIVAE